MYRQRLTLDTYQASSIPISLFYGASVFSFPLQEKQYRKSKLWAHFNFVMHPNEYCGVLSYYLKGESNCICNDLFLYSELLFIMHCCVIFIPNQNKNVLWYVCDISALLWHVHCNIHQVTKYLCFHLLF